MSLRLFLLAENEIKTIQFHFDTIKTKYNLKFEVEIWYSTSIEYFLETFEYSSNEGFFLVVDPTFISEKYSKRVFSIINTNNIPCTLITYDEQSLYSIDKLPITYWNIIKLYQSDNEIHHDFYSAIKSISELSRVKKEKRYLRETLAQSSHMFTLVNEKSEFVYSSPTMKHLHGYEEGELKGKSFVKYIHPDDLYLVLGEFHKVKSSKNYYPTLEFRILTKKGDYIRLECVINNQIDNPDLRSIVINSKDITQLKTYESSLKFQEEKISKVYSLTNLGIWDWDIVNDTVFLNPQMFSLFTILYTEKPFTFDEYLNLYHIEDRIDYKNAILDSYKDTLDFYHEHRINQNSTSEPVWMLDRGAVVERNEVGEPIRIVGTTTNITTRKNAELQLQEMNERMRKLTNSLPGMLYQFVRLPDNSMTCQFVSNGIVELFEIEHNNNSVDLEKFIDRTHPDDVQLVIDTINESAKSLSIWELEYRIILPKKGLRWVHGKSRPEMRENGIVIWHGYIHDITESKRNSEHMLRNQRMESIGTLAGGIAHDLNNVLTPILLSIDILKTQITEPKLVKRLEMIESSTIRGATMVKQVLHFSRGIEGTYSSVNAKMLVDEITIMIQSSFPKNIHYSVKIETDLPFILGDITQLHQVLLNLCVNARDAMPLGGKLEIDVKKFVVNDEHEFRHLQLQKGIYISIIVSDTGEGMTPEVKSRIFEPFYTTKEIGSGTGLGLSTVINIMKSHNGYIDVYSEIGKGSSFRLYLQTTLEETEETEEMPIENFSVKNMEVLVVDDEPVIRDFTRYVLEPLGFIVFEAENGAEGITILSQKFSTISVLIVDTMMPVMDGKTTITIAKKINPDLKIISVSGITQKFTPQDGFDDVLFLQKPYSSKQLLSAIYSLFVA